MWILEQVKPQDQRLTASTAGFTLLEVLVAVAIVAVALTALLRLHLLSLDATLRAQDLTTAVLLAQGKLATMGASPEPGEEQGTFEGPELARFRWLTAVTEHTVALSDSEQQQPLVVRHVEVTVRWIEGQQDRSYTLTTYETQATETQERQ